MCDKFKIPPHVIAVPVAYGDPLGTGEFYAAGLWSPDRFGLVDVLPRILAFTAQVFDPATGEPSTRTDIKGEVSRIDADVATSLLNRPGAPATVREIYLATRADLTRTVLSWWEDGAAGSRVMSWAGGDGDFPTPLSRRSGCTERPHDYYAFVAKVASPPDADLVPAFSLEVGYTCQK